MKIYIVIHIKYIIHQYSIYQPTYIIFHFRTHAFFDDIIIRPFERLESLK